MKASDEDLLKDLLIQELLAWMVDHTELCRLRWQGWEALESCVLVVSLSTGVRHRFKSSSQHMLANSQTP